MIIKQLKPEEFSDARKDAMREMELDKFRSSRYDPKSLAHYMR